MNSPHAHQPPNRKFADLVARWVLGLIFLALGLHKAWQPIHFLKLLRAYEMVSNHYALNWLAATLPWLEIVCGGLLITGRWVRGAALILASLLAVFTAVILQRALQLMATQGLPFWAVKFDCGCGAGEVWIWQKLLENLALFILSLWLLRTAKKNCLP